MRASFLPLLIFGTLALSSCNRDKEPPTVSIFEPAFDGLDVQFGDVFFVEFEATDDRSDGGFWRVELRAGDGITTKTAQAGLWEGSSTGRLVTAFALDAASWPTETMTLAVLADDAAGNRAAAFRDFDYTAAADVPSTLAILTEASDGSSTIERVDIDGSSLGAWSGLPSSHEMAYSSGTVALADATDALVHLIDWSTGESAGQWTDPTSAGSTPRVRRVKRLGVQAGFIIAHAGGVVAIDPAGSLLFERFSEAPWTPVDVLFDATTCVVWEENPATGNHRLRSWDFQTGATGPIVNLAAAPEGWAAVGAQMSGSDGNVALISAIAGLTLCETATGGLDDLCGLLGNGTLGTVPAAAAGLGESEVVFVRGADLCVQSVGPVTSGSVWPVPGTVQRLRTGEGGRVEVLMTGTANNSYWHWDAGGNAPELIFSDLPMNTLDVLLVND